MDYVQRSALVPMFKLGTRGSPLALVQANRVHRLVSGELVVIKTAGDLDQQTPLSELGGKGVFVRELEQALLDGRIDLAVHSLKDVTTAVAPGLRLSAFLKAESRVDSLVVAPRLLGEAGKNPLGLLPQGAKVGTGSIRRKALLLKHRPDLEVVPIRGNVETRLARVKDDLDAVILSHAGLLRLDKVTPNCYALPADLFCPAPGQGVIAIESRLDDLSVLEAVSILNDPIQAQTTMWELQLLEAIAFNCQIPLGIDISKISTGFSLRVFLADPSLTHYWDYKVNFLPGNVVALLDEVGETLRYKIREWGWV